MRKHEIGGNTASWTSWGFDDDGPYIKPYLDLDTEVRDNWSFFGAI